MKTLVFYICVFSLVLFILVKAKIPGEDKEHFTICLNDNNMSRDDMVRVQDTNNSEISESLREQLRKTGCVYQCMLEKMGVMEGSEFKEDELRSKFAERPNPQPGQDILLNTCLDEIKQYTDKCEKSFLLIGCYVIGENKLYGTEEAPGNHEEHEDEHAAK